MSIHPDDLRWIGKLVRETFHISISYFNDLGEKAYMPPEPRTKLDYRFQMKELAEAPAMHTIHRIEHYISLPVALHGGDQGTLIIGPALWSKPSNHVVRGILHDLGLHGSAAEKAMVSYESLPVMNEQKLVNIARLVYFMIHQQQLDTYRIKEASAADLPDPEIGNPELSLSERRQNAVFHQDPMYEKKVFQCIKEGDRDRLLELWKTLKTSYEFGVLSKKSELRSQKGNAIAGITLATRYAIDGGLHAEMAYTMSDSYIQRLEELTTTAEIDRFLEQVLCRFADRVREAQQAKYSKPINQCLHYIFAHLYERVSVADLAEFVSLTPRYLAQLFNTEVQMTIREYIQRAKVEEAKNLMNHTSHTLSEIYSLLNFSDQSHFTKVFKKYTGVTPKQFKKHPIG